MRLRLGERDGVQPRQHVLNVLREHGVEVNPLDVFDQYELVDREGDPVVAYLPPDIEPETIEWLYRRFGELHGIVITEFDRKPN